MEVKRKEATKWKVEGGRGEKKEGRRKKARQKKGCHLILCKQLTLSSSNTPRLILSKISRVALSNAASTFSPERALASTKRRPSSFAHRSASSAETSRVRLPGPVAAAAVDASLPPSSAQRSILLPTNIHVRCGSACSRTSASHDRACSKPVTGGYNGQTSA